MVDLCNFSCVGDCKDRLIRNSIVAGLSNTKAYQQCISKGSNLTLNECIRICQTEDATRRQVQALDQSPQTAMIVHRYTTLLNLPQACPGQASGRGGYRGSTEWWNSSQRGGMGGARPQRDYRCSTKTTCSYCSLWPTSQGKNARLWAKSACTAVECGISQKYVDRSYIINRVTRLQ